MIPNLPTNKAVLTPIAAAAFATLYFLLDLFSILLCVRAAWLGLRTVSPCGCGLSIGTWLCRATELLHHIARCSSWLAHWSGLDLVGLTGEPGKQIVLDKAAYCDITQLFHLPFSEGCVTYFLPSILSLFITLKTL